MWYDYDEQSHIASEKQISYEEGLEAGRKLARQILRLQAAGKTIPEIAAECDVKELLVKEFLLL